MKYIEEYRNSDIAKGLAQRISDEIKVREMTFMEVCGTHTMAIHKHGLSQLLPRNLHLISGPGCPVCVTSNSYIDRAVAYSRMHDVTICTFGDMLRVPGSTSSLEQERSRGGDIRIVYSPMDALQLARQNPDRKVIFLAVGFETTAPTIAVAIQTAFEQKIDNFFAYSAHKTMPNAMAALVGDGTLPLDGFICPAHVSTIIGSKPYEFLVRDFDKACVIIGFEPLDILQGLLMLVEQVISTDHKVEIQYRRVARMEGNPRALATMNDVFEPCDDVWRGLGMIKDSGLKIRQKYSSHDAIKQLYVDVEKTIEPKGCICGLILQGRKKPPDCRLFASQCTPQNPIGACMVSSEGTCAAYYKYSR